MSTTRSRSLALVAALAALLALVAVRPAAAQSTPPAPVLTEDFSDTGLPEGWNPVEGTWEVVDGRLVGTSADSGQQSRITFGPHLDNFRVEATVRFESVVNAARWTAIGLDLAADGSVPWWIATMRSGTTAANGIEFAERTASNGWNVTETAAAPTAAGTGRDVRVAVEVQGNQARWIFDGDTVLTTRSLRRSDDGVLGLVVNGSRVSFDDVVVTELPEPTPVLPADAAPAVIAHRGYSSIAPENTLVAMEMGIRAGADYVEIDAHTTADDVPILMHDQTVDRTTDGTGDVAELTLEYLRTLDAGSWYDETYAGEPVPTLAEALDLIAGTGVTLLLEVKGPETAEEVARMVDLIEERDMVDQVMLQSFQASALTYARAENADLDLGLLRGSLDDDPVAVAEEYDAIAYNPNAAALAARPGVVADLNAAGVAVMPYTLNNPDQWEALVEIGVDGIITDRAGALVGWNARLVQELSEPAPAPTVAITSPTDGAALGREQTPVVAVTSADADEVTVTLDGSPVEVGAPLDLTTLSTGAHTLVATATGEGGTAEATATFTVVPSEAGIAALLLDADALSGAGDQVRGTLLGHLARGDHERLARLADAYAGRHLDADVLALVAADARALADDE